MTARQELRLNQRGNHLPFVLECEIRRARQTQPLGAAKWVHLPFQRNQRIAKQRRSGQRHAGRKIDGQIVITGV